MMKNFILEQLRSMEESTSVNIGLLKIMMNRCIRTDYVLINMFLHFILDSFLSSCVVILSIVSYIDRNKEVFLIAQICNLIFVFSLRFLSYLYESID
ncbi:hypothetical protein ChPV175 [Cheloniid poxvirus 1]|nr:hypothetical protein ChPV175 [Cheloniid poxvirus 1]